MTTSEQGTVDDGAQARAQEGIVHLQAAALETIAAARAFLDVAERLVRDPGTRGAVASLLEAVTDTVARVGRPAETDGGERVQRIRVS